MPTGRIKEINNTDKEYFRLLNIILEKGRVKKNRTGIDTIGIFGAQAKFDVDLGAFPILTTKKVWFKGIVHELLWFISGDTNIKYLVDNDVHIWDEWAYKKWGKSFGYTMPEYIQKIKEGNVTSDLGEGTYGGMWRAFPYSYDEIESEGLGGYSYCKSEGHVDQLQKVIDKLKTNPDDRRMIVSAWHPYWVDHCALPPCHCLFHFNTEELTWSERIDLGEELYPKHNLLGCSDEDLDTYKIPRRRLNCLLYQRSCDTFLGVPFNITSYALLTAMIAHVSNMSPGTFTHTYGDLHIYENHREQVKLQLARDPRPLPKLWLNPEVKSLFDFKYEDIRLEGYDPHPAIKGEVAV
jgi:thymidylate synthase